MKKKATIIFDIGPQNKIAPLCYGSFGNLRLVYLLTFSQHAKSNKKLDCQTLSPWEPLKISTPSTPLSGGIYSTTGQFFSANLTKRSEETTASDGAQKMATNKFQISNYLASQIWH